MRTVVLAVSLLLVGCQSATVALIREPGQRNYAPPVPVRESAERLWEYAVLSSNVYQGTWPAKPPEPAAKADEIPKGTDPDAAACATAPQESLPLDDWRVWTDFPSVEFRLEADDQGLYIEVWEKPTPPTIAVVFKGTQFTSLRDWRANLRWFTRFIPGFTDQYTLLSKRFGLEFVNRLATRPPAPDASPPTITVVATGHSLGGGLAQHFAYSLPRSAANGATMPRVSHVYAFDPSPVTGWYSVESTLRRDNARGLVIDRVFEHGEVLAYVRLAQSYVQPPSAADPGIREIRYNFIQSLDAVSSHSMVLLACNLAQAARKAQPPPALRQ